ncbi:MAG: ornithine cyclodeaminase [Pseudomonadota bacterium]
MADTSPAPRTVTSLSAQDIRAVATWPLVIDALREGHRLPSADINDLLVGSHADDKAIMLVRGAWINGLASGVKAATVVPANPDRTPPLPSVHAQIVLFDAVTGQITGLVDGTEVTAWKTAGDSALGSDLLSRPDSETLLMVGAGAMAAPLIAAHHTVRPNLKRVLVWNRSAARADALVEDLSGIYENILRVEDLEAAVGDADIVCSATMTVDPILKGAWLRPGTHVDLVGAFTPAMRETDDETHAVGRWFVDSRKTTLHHIGELKIPLKTGVIGEGAIQGDLYELVAGQAGRKTPEDITVFKNGGGAHLDIMVSAALVAKHNSDRADA